MRGVRRLPVDDPMNLLTRKPVDGDSPVENSEEEPEILSVESVAKRPELNTASPEEIEPAGLVEPVDTRLPTQTQKAQKEKQKEQKERQKAEHERDAAQREASQSEVTPQKETPQKTSQPIMHPITQPERTAPESSSAVPGFVPGSRSKRSLADLCSQTNSAHKRYRVGLSRNVDPLHRNLHNSIN